MNLHVHPGNLLLRWISETGQGRLRELLDAVNWVDRRYVKTRSPGAAGRWIRDSASLGYLDVDWVNGVWSAAPAVLTRLPASDGLLALTGSRTASALDRLKTAAETDIEYFSISNRLVEGDIPCPDTIVINDDPSFERRELAGRLGATWVPCFAEQIGPLLPDLGFRGDAVGPLEGALVERYNFDKSAFEPIESARHDGLYRFRRADHKRPCQILRDGRWHATTYEEGIFLELAKTGQRESSIRWKKERGAGREHVGRLVVDWGTPLPPLHARAAVMCSGLAPIFSELARTTLYDNVPQKLAARIASSLREHLEEL
jgi:hypothetical protein